MDRDDALIDTPEPRFHHTTVSGRLPQSARATSGPSALPLTPLSGRTLSLVAVVVLAPAIVMLTCALVLFVVYLGWREGPLAGGSLSLLALGPLFAALNDTPKPRQ